MCVYTYYTPIRDLYIYTCIYLFLIYIYIYIINLKQVFCDKFMVFVCRVTVTEKCAKQIHISMPSPKFKCR